MYSVVVKSGNMDGLFWFGVKDNVEYYRALITQPNSRQRDKTQI